MKVTLARPGTEKITRSQRSLKSSAALVLITALVSFAAAWVVKGELGKQGGIRSAAEKWMTSHGYLALNSEFPVGQLLKVPYYLIKPIDAPQLVVDIKFKHFQKLQKKRQQALQKGLLVTGKDDFVPAEIRHEDQTSRVKLRLKGDLLDHLKGNKWSFRVKVRGKDQLYGMRVFSIQSPAVRGFLGGPLFYASLQRYGVMAPRTRLVSLVVNGNDMGIMSIEEHFSKEMLEASGRKESVIIRFDESLVWDARDGRKHAGLGGHFDNYHTAVIDAFGSGKISRSTRLSNDLKVATGLLRAFETGKLPPSRVFDTELMGRYMAVSELWGSWHSFSWRNLRFYYNPLTARLEPIGYDPDIQTRSRPGANNASGEPITSVMRSALLDDPEIFSAFRKALALISKDIKNGSLYAELEKIQSEYLPVLRKEFFFLQAFDRSELEQRLALLENYSREDLDRLYQISHTYPGLLQAYRIDTTDGSQIELQNITPSFVDILAIHWVANKNKGNKAAVDAATDVSLPLSLPPLSWLGKPAPKIIRFTHEPAIEKDHHLEVVAKVQGTYQADHIKVTPYYSALTTSPVPESSLQQQTALHKDYLHADSASGALTIRAGAWQVLKPIIVPRGSTLAIGPATTLQFAQDAGIIAHGDLRIQGTADAPVKLQGMNTDSWQGVAVLNAPGKSVVSRAQISAAKGITGPAWNLTGGVSFYKSDVNIENSLIEDSRGEDALNIIHSEFTLDNVTIRNTLSDAFDADFSAGSVTGGLYQDVGLAGGGDAIDVSGSRITIASTRFIAIDDKAVSAGEGSQVQASGLQIDSIGTGAACKDASTLDIKTSTIVNARVAGLLAYIKKPEYGPARINASDISFGDGFETARVQQGSQIMIDDTPVKTSDFDVDKLYKTVMKPGLRK